MTNEVAVVASAAGIIDPGRVDDDDAQRPDPEVPERARRRSFTAKYKLEILAAYDAADGGEEGALLRREVCTPRTLWCGGARVTPARWPD